MNSFKLKLIEKIEGEAKLNISYHDKKIDFVEIEFFQTRGIENILKNRPALDALVINPRVCGICGHAHLQATVKALESCYHDIVITKKAEILRELTLNFEIIQNHFKWFYLTLLPLLGEKQKLLKATKPTQLLAKAIAVFGGQYPHNSYSIVGGVVSEPTMMDVLKVESLIDSVINYFETEMVKADTNRLLECENSENIVLKDGDLPKVLQILKERKLTDLGRTHDRFIVFGENSYFNRGKSIKTRVTKSIDEKFIEEIENKNSFAKNALYKDKYYEVGSLSRAMLNKTPLIKDAHRRYGDSIFSRILARVCEIPQLLQHSKKLLKELDLSEPSYIKPSIEITDINAEGRGSVEAARGSLVHKVKLNSGMIEEYTIITPTQWNLSNGTREKPAPAQKAMFGLESEDLAELVFKSFDVCSVCTTH